MINCLVITTIVIFPNHKSCNCIVRVNTDFKEQISKHHLTIEQFWNTFKLLKIIKSTI